MKKLTEVRLAYGKTKTDLANVLGITRQAYSNYENDVRTPSAETLMRIAGYYGVNIEELLDFDNADCSKEVPRFSAAVVKAMEIYSKLPESRRQFYLEMMRYDLEFLGIKE